MGDSIFALDEQTQLLCPHSCYILCDCFIWCQESICYSGTICNDNDACTGTNSKPDTCENGICIPGELFCPLYSKKTNSALNTPTGELFVTNDDKWEYLIWKRESEFVPSKVFLYVGVDPPESDDP